MTRSQHVSYDAHAVSPLKGSSWKDYLHFCGPGWFVAIAYLDPGNTQTDIQVWHRWRSIHLLLYIPWPLTKACVYIVQTSTNISLSTSFHSSSLLLRPVLLLVSIIAISGQYCWCVHLFGSFHLSSYLPLFSAHSRLSNLLFYTHALCFCVCVCVFCVFAFLFDLSLCLKRLQSGTSWIHSLQPFSFYYCSNRFSLFFFWSIDGLRGTKSSPPPSNTLVVNQAMDFLLVRRFSLSTLSYILFIVAFKSIVS